MTWWKLPSMLSWISGWKAGWAKACTRTFSVLSRPKSCFLVFVQQGFIFSHIKKWSLHAEEQSTYKHFWRQNREGGLLHWHPSFSKKGCWMRWDPLVWSSQVIAESLSCFFLQGGTWRLAAAKGSVLMSLSHWLLPSSVPRDSWASTTWWLGVFFLMTCRRNLNSIYQSTLAQNAWFLFKDLEVLAVKLSWVLWPPKQPSACIFGRVRLAKVCGIGHVSF